MLLRKSTVRSREGRLYGLPLAPRLFIRDFEVLEHCSNRGGDLKIVAAILEKPLIECVRTRQDLPAQRHRGRRHAGTRSKLPDDGPELRAAVTGCAWRG